MRYALARCIIRISNLLAHMGARLSAQAFLDDATERWRLLEASIGRVQHEIQQHDMAERIAERKN